MFGSVGPWPGHRPELLTPAALSAVSISLSEAVFADTFVTAGPVVPPGGADMLVGAADGEGKLSPGVVVPG